MIKRPLCLAMLLLLGIKLLLVGEVQHMGKLDSLAIEQSVEEGTPVKLLGTVSCREEGAKYQIIYLTDVKIYYNLQELSMTDPISCMSSDPIINESKLLVYIEQYYSEIEKILIGNQILVEGKVSYFDPATNPGNFNQKFYYQKQRINACVWADNVKITNSGTCVLKEKLAVFRTNWKELLVEQMGEKYGGSMSAILLGDKSGLEADTKELYQKSGIGHILAISGLHMSFIGVGFYKLLRRAGVSFSLSGVVGILFLDLYTMMIGSGVSSIRALIMFMIRIGAEMSGRVYDLPTSLSIAAAVIVFWQPYYFYDAGFLLSFGAILGITSIEPILRFYHIFPKFLCGGMAIWLVTFPIILYFYFEIPFYSQILNLMIIPLMSVVIGAGIAGSLVCLVWTSAGNLILKLCSAILWLYGKACEISMELPCSRIVTGQPQIWTMAVYYIVLFGAAWGLWRYKEHMEKEQDIWRKKS